MRRKHREMLSGHNCLGHSYRFMRPWEQPGGGTCTEGAVGSKWGTRAAGPPEQGLLGGTQFTSSTNLSLGCASRSGVAYVTAVSVWGHLSFCEEPKVDICPGSAIFFGKAGLMIYNQVMYCGDWLKFAALQEMLLTEL